MGETGEVTRLLGEIGRGQKSSTSLAVGLESATLECEHFFASHCNVR